MPCTGGSTWSHLNLTIEGSRERVLAARKLFTKLWASFVDLSCGLDRIGAQYAIEWPKNCVYWSWDRIRKWLKSHELPEVTFDGCRLGLKDSHGTPVKKPWRIATSCKAIVKAFKNKTCRGGHSHAKCLKDSEDYTPKVALLVHQAFALQAAERRQNRCAVAALPAQPATPAIPYAPVFAENMASSSSAAAFLADAASPNQETMQANMRRFLQRLDENRPAGARANKQTPAWLIEALTKIEEPPADADDQDRFLGIIPVTQWRELREEFPSMAWIMLVEVWYRQYGVSMAIPNRTITDTTLAGWSCRMKEFIEDVSVLAWGPSLSRIRSWLRRSMTSAIALSSSTKEQAPSPSSLPRSNSWRSFTHLPLNASHLLRPNRKALSLWVTLRWHFARQAIRGAPYGQSTPALTASGRSAPDPGLTSGAR